MKEVELNLEELRTLIQKKGLRMNWLAHECGVSASHLSNGLAGRLKLGRPLIKLLAIKLEVDEAKLLKTIAS